MLPFYHDFTRLQANKQEKNIFLSTQRTSFASLDRFPPNLQKRRPFPGPARSEDRHFRVGGVANNSNRYYI